MKNVAGYDLCKLFTGSYGTLGTIVELNFKLRPLPAATRTLIASGRRLDLLAAARRILDARLFPVALELISPGLAEEGEGFERTEHLLLTRFAGSETGVAQQITDATAIVQQTAKLSARPEVNDNATWESLASWPLASKENLVWRACVRTSDLETFLAELDQIPDVTWTAGSAEGRVRVVQTLQPSDNERETFFAKAAAQIAKLRATAVRLGGSLVIEHAPAQLKHLAGAWRMMGSAGPVMQRIKHQLDPDNILSPGRFKFETTNND